MGQYARKRTNYFQNVFPLVKEPLIEAIPKYKPGENSKPEELKNIDGLSGNEAERSTTRRDIVARRHRL